MKRVTGVMFVALMAAAGAVFSQEAPPPPPPDDRPEPAEPARPQDPVRPAEPVRDDKPVRADQPALIDCKMTFNLKGWSAVYRTAKGDGTITCDNGEEHRVNLRVKGGGLTFGKSEVVAGTGRFTRVKNVDQLFGAYAAAEAHAGAGASANAQALTKGKVSLTLVGTGPGVNLGLDFSRFVIRPAEEERKEKNKGTRDTTRSRS
jgi:hypothetical protein